MVSCWMVWGYVGDNGINVDGDSVRPIVVCVPKVEFQGEGKQDDVIYRPGWYPTRLFKGLTSAKRDSVSHQNIITRNQTPRS